MYVIGGQVVVVKGRYRDKTGTVISFNREAKEIQVRIGSIPLWFTATEIVPQILSDPAQARSQPRKPPETTDDAPTPA